MHPTPLIVILPGLEGRGEMSGPTAELAREEIDVLQISYPNDRTTSIEELGAYAEEQIPIDRPIILLGVSFSGPLTIQLLASKRRNYIAGIFCTTFARAPRPFLLTLAKRLPIRPLFKLTSTIFQKLGQSDRLLRTFFLEPDSPSIAVDTIRLVGEEVPPTIFAERVEQLASINNSDLLKTIDIPCCALRASRDRIIPKNASHPFTEHLTTFTLHNIKGPHALLLAKPEECWGVIRGFLAEHSLLPNQA